MNRIAYVAVAALLTAGACLAEGTYLGKLSQNRNDPDSVANPHGIYGSPYSSKSINNPNGIYGSEHSPLSPFNPYSNSAPKLYDSRGVYRGRLSINRNDPDSTSNPYGRYGSRSSMDSINNPYGFGHPGRLDSPNNPYGQGVSIYADDEG